MIFSERNSFKSVRSAIQKDALDEPTRNALWNVVGPYFNSYAKYCDVYVDLWTNLYENTSDTRPVAADRYADDDEHFRQYYRNKILKGEWFECFDIIEFLVDPINAKKWHDQIYASTYKYDCVLRPVDFKPVFERYMIGYRFVGTRLISITSEEEILAIEGAVSKSQDSVAEQLSKAVSFLANRKTPDYAKSVDCAISAVEAQCRHLLGSQTPTLGKALKQLEDSGICLHGSLKSAFEKLYGFTSDANGIRHAGLMPSNVDADLAKFMLVSCAAFVNYLRSKQKIK